MMSRIGSCKGSFGNAKASAAVLDARMCAKMSIEALAEASRVPVATVQRIESGEPGVGIGAIAKVMRALGLDGDFRRMASFQAAPTCV